MLQLHLSDRQFYCLLRCVLYERFYGNIKCIQNISWSRAGSVVGAFIPIERFCPYRFVFEIALYSTLLWSSLAVCILRANMRLLWLTIERFAHVDSFHDIDLQSIFITVIEISLWLSFGSVLFVCSNLDYIQWGVCIVTFSSVIVWSVEDNWRNSQIPECTCPISHDVPFRTEMYTSLSGWSIVG